MFEGDPWVTLKSGIDGFDKEMCNAWNGELDTMLTFVCLDFNLELVTFEGC